MVTYTEQEIIRQGSLIGTEGQRRTIRQRTETQRTAEPGGGRAGTKKTKPSGRRQAEPHTKLQRTAEPRERPIRTTEQD